MIRCPKCGLRVDDRQPECRQHGPVSIANTAPSAAGPSSPPPASPLDFVLDGYRVTGMLGQGGFGFVLRAERNDDGAPVAIKVALREQLAGAELLAREADALSKVGPPFVPVMFARGEVDEQPYVVMEMVKAPLLADLLVSTAGPMALSLFEKHANAMLETLEAIHAQGFVHGDLKPENIFLTDSGSRFIDFGLVKTLDEVQAAKSKLQSESNSEPEHGDAAGTAEYMAPEQCEGRRDTDQRADIYAMGVIFYEMLSGAPPFWGNSAEVREAHRSRRPGRLGNRLQLAAELDDVILRALGKDPEKRFANTVEFRKALRAALVKAHGKADETGPKPAQGVAKDSPGATAQGADKAAAPKAAAARDKRPVGLVFFTSTAGAGPVQQALQALGGQMAQASGTQYVAVFGHEVGDNPARSAMFAAQSLIERKLCSRGLVDVAQVTIQVRPDGGRRFMSPLFTRKDRFPLATDPEAVLLTTASSEVLPDVITKELADRPGVLVAETGGEEVSAFTTMGGKDEAIIGREALLEELLGMQRKSAADGVPTLVTVTSEPGYGKSHLAGALVRRLEKELPAGRVLAFAGHESIGGAANQTLPEWIKRVLSLPAQKPEDGGRAIFGERLGEPLAQQVWAAAALALGWVSQDHPEVRTLSAAPGALRAAGARALGEGLRRRAKGGAIAVVFDDAHLADDVTLDAIEYALLKEARSPIYMTVFARPALGHTRPTWGDRAAETRHTPIGALNRDSAADLLRRLLLPVEYIPQSALALLIERTQGVPRLMVELVRGLKREGLIKRSERGTASYLATEELERLPNLPIVQWAATREVEALPEQLRAHARLASVLGSNFTADDIDSLLRILEEEGDFEGTDLDASIGLRRLIDAGLLTTHRSGSLDFRHSLLRETVYQSVSEPLRARIHSAALRVYQLGLGTEPNYGNLLRVAFHASRSDQKEIAADTYLAAAEIAQRRQAYLDAELAYGNALEQLASASSRKKMEASRGRGKMRFRLGRYEHAMKDLGVARAEAETLSDGESVVEILLDEAETLDWTHDFKQSSELVELASNRRETHSAHTQARILCAKGRSEHRSGRFDASVATLSKAADLAASLGDMAYETQIVALVTRGAACLWAGRVSEADLFFNEAILAAEAHGDQLHKAAALNNRAVFWFLRQEADNVIRELDQVRQIAREMGFPSLEWLVEDNLGETYYAVGELDVAASHAKRNLEIGERLWGPSHPSVIKAEILLGRIEAYRPNLEEALDVLKRIEHRESLANLEGISDVITDPAQIALREMISLTVRGAPYSEWDALAEKLRIVSSQPQEWIEVIEAKGMHAWRQGDMAQAQVSFRDALEVAATTPNLMSRRVQKNLDCILNIVAAT